MIFFITTWAGKFRLSCICQASIGLIYRQGVPHNDLSSISLMWGPGSNSIKMLSTGSGGTQQVQQPLKFRATAIICERDEAKGSLPVSGKLILPCRLKWRIFIPEVAAAGRFLMAPRFLIASVGYVSHMSCG